LLEGLNEFFESKPVDEFKIAAEFMKTINERREAKIDHRRILLDNKNKRKMRQNKIEPSTSTSISFPMPLIGQLMESSKTYTHT
jgi:hypothetical protein